MAGQQVPGGVKHGRDQHQKRRQLDHSRAGAQHDDHAQHSDDHRRPASRPDLFAQKGDRHQRDDDRADIGHRHRICQGHGRQADKEGDVGDHHDHHPHQMRARATGGDLRPPPVGQMDDAQDEGQRDHRPDQDHLMQGIAGGQELDRHVVDRKDQRATDGKQDSGQGLRTGHRAR